MVKRESFLQSIGSAVVWNTSERITGLIKHIIVAAFIGLSAQLDIFYMAIAIIGMFVFSWASMIDVMAVPQMVHCYRENRKEKFQQITGGLFLLCIIFSLVLALVIFFFNDLISKIAIGFEPYRQNLLSEALIWLLPVVIVYIPYRLVASIFRSIRSFSIFYQAEFIIGFVALLLLFAFKDQHAILLWSYSAGVVCAFIFLFIYCLKYFKPWGNPFSKEVRAVFQIAPALLLLQGSQYLFVLSDRIFISFLPKGSVGALAYGRMLAYILSGIVSFRASFITIFAELDDSSEKKQSLYNDIISLSIFFAMPICIFLTFFGESIIGIFLERGVFSKADTVLVYKALSGFAWALLPVLAIGPIEQIFQVQKRIDLLVLRRVIGLILNGGLNALFLFVFQWGLWGIAMATSISHWFVFILAIFSAKQTGLLLELRRTAFWFSWISLLSISASFLITMVSRTIHWPYFVIVQFIVYGLFVLSGTILYKGKEGELVRKTIGRIVVRKQIVSHNKF
jgi:putative peptidoglycan lipid II flippase